MNECVESRRKLTEHEREGGEGTLVVGDRIEIELCVSPGVGTSRIHEPKRDAVEERAPSRRTVHGMRDPEAPQQFERLAPRRDDEHHRFAAGIDGRDEDRSVDRDVPRRGEAHRARERRGAQAEHRAETGSRPERLTAPSRVPKPPPGGAHVVCSAVARQPFFEKRLRQQMAGKSRKHQRDGSRTSRRRGGDVSTLAIDSRNAIRCAIASDISVSAARSAACA